MTTTKAAEDVLVEKVARALIDEEYSDGRPWPMVEPPWGVKVKQARAAIEASGITTLLERERRLSGSAKALLEKLDGNSAVRWQFVNERESLRAALTREGE